MNKKNYAIIIQARLDSKRFPQKILKKLHKKEILTIMLERLKKNLNHKMFLTNMIFGYLILRKNVKETNLYAFLLTNPQDIKKMFQQN